MSTLSAISKRLDDLSASLGAYQTRFVEFRSQTEVSHAAHLKLSDLTQSVHRDTDTLQNNVKADVDKLVLKLDQKDPVTGAMRYGEASKAKITGFAKRVEELSLEFTHLKSDLDNYTAANGTSLSDVPPVPPVDVKLSRLQAPVMGPIRNIDRYVEFPTGDAVSASTAAKSLSPEDIELEEKARQVRERKAHEAEHHKNVQEQLHAQLEDYIVFFNSIADLQAKRIASKSEWSTVDERIAQLALNEKIQTLREALKTILGILERIISRPDDIAARRLRITHPVLKEKLTRVSGGIELLMALGFRARLQKLETPTDAKSTTNAQLVPLATLETTLAAHRQHSLLSDPSSNVTYGVRIFELLSPATLYEVHLEMQEPSLESLTSSSAEGSGKTDKLSWLDWFDSLGIYKASIEEALARA